LKLIRRLAIPFGLVLVAGCAQAAPAAVSTPIPTAQASPSESSSGDVDGVSLSAPTSQAEAGIKACGVRAHATQIHGIGILARARLLPEYVPLTGREPEIQSDSPAFVVQFTGRIRLWDRAGPESAPFTDSEDATCVMLDEWPTWYVTGPWFDSDGRHAPEPAPMMDKTLPAPLP
jgi:hypothetical protein